MKVIEEDQRVCVMEGSWNPLSVIKEIVEEGTQEDPFYVMDLGEVVARFHQWKELMPRVEPFYAVKCNDDKYMVSTLAALGAGFDCASKAEIDLVTSFGVHPERIIFANPAKPASHIRWARAAGVTTLTFDSETELIKTKQYMPEAQLVIRIRCDAASARCSLGIKFGCDPVSEAPRLLKVAAVLGLAVIGVSFHVGSGAEESAAYARAIQHARDLFTTGGAAGHSMCLLDIGGGFPGHSGSDITETSRVINSSLETYFPSRSVRVIAEPGRYFAAAAYTLAAMVHATRELTVTEDGEPHTMYFINDGVYGSFNCLLYDHQEARPIPLEESAAPPQPCSVWGPTCDSLDCVAPRCRLPPLRTGAWLVFRDMGAYTMPVASAFNGFPVPKVRAVVDSTLWSVLKKCLPLTEAQFDFGPVSGPQTPPPPATLPPVPLYVEVALK